MKTPRLLAAACLGLAVMHLISTASRSGEPKRQPVEPAPTDQFEIRNIEGWQVYIGKKDLVDHAAEMNKAIDHLRNQFYQVRLAVPAPAVAIMQERVPLWVEYDANPGTSFHPSYRWLLSRGYPSPRGLKSLVSVTRAGRFLNSSLHQPWVICHELAHGYDYRYLGRGRHYSNARLKAAYQRAKKSGSYESVLCRYSKGTRHYGMNNPMEYFAENTEAYFGANDFYPFVRAELKQHDPQMYALLQDLWGVDVKLQNRATRSLARFIDRGGGAAATANGECGTACVPTAEYQERQIEGWTVHVCPSLVRQQAYGDETCKLLRHKLHLIRRYMPEKALEKLQKVPVWLEKDSPAVPYMAYHASAEELKSAGLNPDKLHAIEIGDPEAFLRWQSLQPFMLLNQLSRAYYGRFLSEEEVAEIKTALQCAIKGGKYDSVLRFDGKRVRHPALASPVDFFAELTESYYGINDHYPFLQFEARQHDPETCRLLAKLWGGKAK